MRIPIDSIGGLNIHEKTQSLQIKSLIKDLKSQEIMAAKFCSLRINGRKLDCKIVSLNGKKKNTHILIELARDKELTILLEPHVYSDAKGFLLVSERVDFALYNEVKKLLEEESQQSGKSIKEILLELTRYKEGVEGYDSIVFVSNKQLAVLKDRLSSAADS